MKIVQLVAGAGGMYCGSCLHGNTLAAALRAAGEDVTLLPLYTPLRTDEMRQSVDHVAFSGVNVYLQEHSAVFRHTPWFVDRLVDRPWLSRKAAAGARVRPEQLGKLTVSMLRGEEGRQRKELEKLIRWLQQEVRPDVIHLGNVMLAGLARELSRRLNVPVVCTLSGEDVFLEKLPEPHRAEAKRLLRERSADLAAIAAMNRYFAGFMAEYLAVPAERIRVIPPGLNLIGHATPDDAPRAGDRKSGTVSIGYLARICPEKGLHNLAEALILLHQDPDVPPVRVRAAGFFDDADRPYLDGIEQRMAECRLPGEVKYVGELGRAAKIEFLQSLDVMCLPTVYRESKGLSVLEAWANGVPTVLPAHGAFPEMVDDTGGGLAVEPDDAAALAAGLKRMILEPDFAADCGQKAQRAVHQRYHARRMAERTIAWYREAMEAFP